MHSRAVLLVGLVLASSAWAQQPATNPPALSPRAFDLASDSIRKIVRDTAATQYALVQIPESRPAKQNPISAIDFSKPAKLTPMKQPAPASVTAPATDGFLYGLFSTLLDVATEDWLRDKATVWHDCQPRSDNSTPQISVMCPDDL